jgi:hypothetical protein
MSNFAARPAHPAGGSAVTGHHVLARALTVLGAVAAAVGVWVTARVTGAVPEVPMGLEQEMQPLGAGPVIAASLSAGLAAWVLSLLLEHQAARPRRLWTATAVGAFFVSLLPILSVDDRAGQVALACMHAAVAVVLVIGIGRTLPAARP